MAHVIAGVICLFLACAVSAQQAEVKLSIAQEDIGLGGYVRPGGWTPLRVTMTNQSPQLLSVRVRWIVADEDGDVVLAERATPLNVGLTQQLWLYANLPITTRPETRWTLQVLDAESNRELARTMFSTPNMAEVTQTIIGVCAAADMGLHDYEPGYTQHESIRFVRSLTLANLPDRWYGLSAMSALIWTPEDDDPLNDPLDAAVTPAVVDALRAWVRRGGHLVIMLPAVGQRWSDSPLADLMPVEKQRMIEVNDFDTLAAITVVATPSAEGRLVSAVRFDLTGQTNAVAIALGLQKLPYIVARRYGFGCVTLVGIDLTSDAVRKLGVPTGQERIWNKVFHWTAPVYTQQVYESEVREGKMLSLTARTLSGLPLDSTVPGLIAMTGMAAPALLSAIVVFALYWVLAGPVSYVYLKRRGMAHHAWLLFVILAGVFTALTWGGAWLLRPAHTSVEHVSVLDADANTSAIHVRSWFTLLVPQFGTATVALDQDNIFPGQVLGSPGFEAGQTIGGFLDPQQYAIDSADPRHVTIPVRSTAKRFALDYLGKLDTSWALPQGELTMDENNVWPVGKLTHNLPGGLKNVLVLYSPGTTTVDGDMYPPWVGMVREWPAGAVLELTSPPSKVPMTRLVQPPRAYTPDRVWEQEGYLGMLIAWQKGRVAPTGNIADVNDAQSRQLLMLSFYDALPAPNFRDTNVLSAANPTFYQRTIMRPIDLTPLLAGRRLIIIGLLEHSPLPAPLTLDGSPIPADGLTLVRWVYDL